MFRSGSMGHRVFLAIYHGLFNGFEGFAVGSHKVPKGVGRAQWRIVTFFGGCCNEYATLLIC